MELFKRDSIDVVDAAVKLDKDAFYDKMLESYPNQNKSILAVVYAANRKKYKLNEKGDIVVAETGKLLQAKTEWINEDENQEEPSADSTEEKPKKVKKEKVVKEPKPAKEPKAPKEQKPKKEKAVKEPKEPKAPRISKYASYERKFAPGDKVAFYAGFTENTGVVRSSGVRTLGGNVVEIVLIDNDDVKANENKKGGVNAVNANKVRFIDGEYDETFKKERRERAAEKSERKQKVSKYADLVLKFNLGEQVAFLKKGANGEPVELVGTVKDSFYRTAKKNGESIIFNQVGVDVNNLPYYKNAVYLRSYPDGVYEPVPLKNSGRKPKPKEEVETAAVEETKNEEVLNTDTDSQAE